jgi:hypothetical protein
MATGEGFASSPRAGSVEERETARRSRGGEGSGAPWRRGKNWRGRRPFVLQGFRVLIMPWLVVSGLPSGQNGPYVMGHLVSTHGLA